MPEETSGTQQSQSDNQLDPKEPQNQPQGQSQDPATPEWQGTFQNPEAIWDAYKSIQSEKDKISTQANELSVRNQLYENVLSQQQQPSQQVQAAQSNLPDPTLDPQGYARAVMGQIKDVIGSEMNTLRVQTQMQNFRANHPEIADFEMQNMAQFMLRKGLTDFEDANKLMNFDKLTQGVAQQTAQTTVQNIQRSNQQATPRNTGGQAPPSGPPDPAVLAEQLSPQEFQAWYEKLSDNDQKFVTKNLAERTGMKLADYFPE